MNALRIGLLLALLTGVCCNSGLAQARSAWAGAPARFDSEQPKAVINAQALTGLWYAPSQNGHGFALTFADDGRVAATWYVYQGTRQVWLIGSGTISGNRAVLPTVITSGASFPPAFDPGQVALTPWGTLTLDVLACNRIAVSWSSTLPGFSSGAVEVQPLIVGGGQACTVRVNDDHGDDCATATAAAPNGTVSGRIDPAEDSDFFRVVVAQRGALIARSRAQVGLDPIGALYDANCQLLEENDDSDDKDFAVAQTVDPGTYYVSIASYARSSSGTYAVDVTLDTAVGADDFADTCSGAGTLALDTPVDGRIDPETDVDVFRLVLDRPGVILAASSQTDALDPVGTILDSNCQPVAENDDFDGHDFAVSTMLEAGTWYVQVKSYDNSSSGTYRLNARRIEASGDDHGDFCSIATPFTPGATLSGQINPGADEDFFRFEIADPGTVLFETNAASGLDPLLSIFDASCRGFTDDDDTGPGANAALTLALDAGTYYVRVRAADGLGAYTMSSRFIATRAGSDEHGDSCATATPVSLNGAVFARIDPALDQDFFRIVVEEPGLVAAVSYSDGLDPAGALFDASCSLIEQDDDSSDDGINFAYSAQVQPGTYYLRVTGATQQRTGEYRMTYGFEPAAGVPVASGAKDAPAPAAPIAAPPAAQFSSRDATAWSKTPLPAAPKAVTNPSSLSGLWYDPAQNGQGVQITFDATGTVGLTWYVYAGTRQLWLVGSAALVGNRVTIPMFISDGADFPPAFDAASVRLTPWGNITLDVRSCSAIAMSWAPSLAGYTAGSMNLTPLIVSGGLTCAVSSEADDHGNDCASATAAPLNTGVAGRIDPSSDADVFRLALGAAGTLTVQSSGSSTLNPSGTLLDASCNALASNDDAAGREFSISRALAAGTYFVRVAASGGGSVGDYVFGSSFAPSGGSNASATLTLRDDLVYDLDFRINGGPAIRVAAGTSVQQAVSVVGALNVTFQLVDAVNAQGQPVGDLLGGAFDPVGNPSGALTFAVDNEVGAQRYFVPVMGNKTTASFLAGVNMGTSAESRCNCVVPAGGKDLPIGYYLLLPNSNVRAYAVGSNYTGPYSYWGSDTGGGTPLFNIPLANLLETPSGRVNLKYIVFGR